jgi:hypothetical protein
LTIDWIIENNGHHVGFQNTYSAAGLIIQTCYREQRSDSTNDTSIAFKAISGRKSQEQIESGNAAVTFQKYFFVRNSIVRGDASLATGHWPY